MRKLNTYEVLKVSGGCFLEDAWDWWVDYNQQMLEAERHARSFGSSSGGVDQSGVPADGSSGELAQP